MLWLTILVSISLLLWSEHRAGVCCVHQAYCHSRTDSVSSLICHCIINCYLLFTCPPILNACTACLYGVGQCFCHRYPFITTAAHLSRGTVEDKDACFATALTYTLPVFLTSSSSYPSELPALVPATRTTCTPRKHRLNSSQHPSAVNQNLHSIFFTFLHFKHYINSLTWNLHCGNYWHFSLRPAAIRKFVERTGTLPWAWKCRTVDHG